MCLEYLDGRHRCTLSVVNQLHSGARIASVYCERFISKNGIFLYMSCKNFLASTFTGTGKDGRIVRHLFHSSTKLLISFWPSGVWCLHETLVSSNSEKCPSTSRKGLYPFAPLK